MPFRDPHPGSTVADTLPRRFQEAEHPSAYIFALTTSTGTLSADVNTGITWTTYSTAFESLPLNPSSVQAVPAPVNAMYDIKYQVGLAGSVASTVTVFGVLDWKDPTGSVTREIARVNGFLSSVGNTNIQVTATIPMRKGETIQAFVQVSTAGISITTGTSGTWLQMYAVGNHPDA